MKKRRLELGLLQREVAKELRISDASYHSWENDLKETMIRFMPRLIEWLEYDPFPKPTTAGEEIVAMRRRMGMSRKKLARQLVIDVTTLERIEKSRVVLTVRLVGVMREALTARSGQETREAANL